MSRRNEVIPFPGSQETAPQNVYSEGKKVFQLYRVDHPPEMREISDLKKPGVYVYKDTSRNTQVVYIMGPSKKSVGVSMFTDESSGEEKLEVAIVVPKDDAPGKLVQRSVLFSSLGKVEDVQGADTYAGAIDKAVRDINDVLEELVQYAQTLRPASAAA